MQRKREEKKKKRGKCDPLTRGERNRRLRIDIASMGAQMLESADKYFKAAIISTLKN